MREEISFGIILADLDHFKYINDKYGHLCGDAVLKEAARRMVGCARPYDTVGRYGGEEFLIVVPSSGGLSALLNWRKEFENPSTPSLSSPRRERSPSPPALALRLARKRIRSIRRRFSVWPMTPFTAPKTGRNRSELANPGLVPDASPVTR